MSKKRPSKPVWWKNTFFWFGFALFGLALWGMSAGENVIRDPGQKFETGLVLFYLVAAVVMLVNGVMTHSQSVQSYQELTGEGVEDDLEDESFYDESEGDEER